MNAYDLNNTIQFSTENKILNNIETFVINLDRRPDRWEKFREKIKKYNLLNYQRFSAIDGSKLKPNRKLNKIFEGNDYNMRKGIVGAALSHLQLWIKLINSDNDFFLILEDDIEFIDDFQVKLTKIINEIKNINWDIIYLGHSAKHKKSNNENLKIEKYNFIQSINESYGGAFAYIINKNGAEKMLDYINTNGMTNAIDTMQQKAADFINVFYIEPHLITTDCHCLNNNIDTDIQNDIDSTLNMNLNDIIDEEFRYLKSFNIQPIKSYDELIKYIQNLQERNVYYKNNDQNVIEKLFIICNMCLNKTHIYYTIESNILIILNKNDYNNFKPTIYNERLKKYNNYDISDAIVYI